MSHIGLSIFLFSCASIDRGMMAASDGISSADPVTGERQINFEPEDAEINRATKTTREILSQLKAKGIKVDEETLYFDRVKYVFERLRIVVHRRHLPWEVHVIENNELNAYTIGGGKVFVFTGMFKPDIEVQTDDELAAVLAHEIAHVTARHVSEGQGKLVLFGLADKSLRDNRFRASFTTIQEDEVDRFSVIYSALAGYNPEAGIKIWERLHNAFGSYTGNLLFDHPLNDDRANNMRKYADQAKQYYIANEINPEHDAILMNNTVFSYRDTQEIKAGEGGGFGLFGVAINATNKKIEDAKVVIEYLSQGTVVFSEDMQWDSMYPYARKDFGIKLKSISYSSVRIRPKYVHIIGESK